MATYILRRRTGVLIRRSSQVAALYTGYRTTIGGDSGSLPARQHLHCLERRTCSGGAPPSAGCGPTTPCLSFSYRTGRLKKLSFSDIAIRAKCLDMILVRNYGTSGCSCSDRVECGLEFLLDGTSKFALRRRGTASISALKVGWCAKLFHVWHKETFRGGKGTMQGIVTPVVKPWPPAS